MQITVPVTQSTGLGETIEVGELPTAIPATNVADGSVTNAEFQYINGLTSDAQTQLDAKPNTSVVGDALNVAGKTTAPTANDDASDTSGNGVFSVGSRWIDETGDATYICVDATATAAVWNQIDGGGGGVSGVAIGATVAVEPVASGDDSVAIGDGAIAYAKQSVSYGPGARTGFTDTEFNGQYGVAVGYASNANANGSAGGTTGAVAVGGFADATGFRSVSLGYEADATDQYAIAIGAYSEVSQDNSIGIGDSATVSGQYAVGLGSEVDVTNSYAIGLGRYAQATGQYGVAIGGGTSTTDAANAIGLYSLSIGRDSSATQNGSMAIGCFAESTGTYALAIGTGGATNLHALATNNYAIAIGSDTTASGVHSIAIGRESVATGGNSICIGSDDFGQSATAAGATAVGSSSVIAALRGASLGYDCYIASTGVSALALGAYATNPRPDSVVFGTGDSSRTEKMGIGSLVAVTTDATQTELASNNSGYLDIPSDTTIMYTISIAARRTDVDGESAAYVLRGCIDNNAGTTALVGALDKTVLAEDTAAWDVTAEADDTNDRLAVKVTGEAGKTIRWLARIDFVEITG